MAGAEDTRIVRKTFVSLLALMMGPGMRTASVGTAITSSTPKI